VATAIGGPDKEKIEKALHDAMEWLDANQQAEVRMGMNMSVCGWWSVRVVGQQ